jgi:hypothetical protein
MTMLSSQHVRRGITAIGAIVFVACAVIPAFAGQESDMSKQKQQAVELLKSIETGDPRPLAYINPDKYIQHNLAVADGLAGVKALLQSLPKGSAKVIDPALIILNKC